MRMIFFYSRPFMFLQNNEKLANNYTCRDCGHTAKKPYPPMPDGKKLKKGELFRSFESKEKVTFSNIFILFVISYYLFPTNKLQHEGQ